jgi:acyl-coenzyme A thioesterase PaaI-like protein
VSSAAECAMTADEIRKRVLKGIARNREPGFHFAGNFLEVSYDRVAAQGARVSLEPGAHCVDPDGQTSIGAIAMLADIALATSIRAALGSDSTRLATVSMNLQFTGIEARGRLEGEGHFLEFFHGAAARQGMSCATLTSGERTLCSATGAFMALQPPPGVTMHPVVRKPSGKPAAVSEADLDASERTILAHADAVLSSLTPRKSFIRGFWGYEGQRVGEGAQCAMKNGPHVGNRVGHAQGGILVGLAASTAIASLPATWALSSVAAYFVSPGEGRELHATSKIIHHGRETAVVRTQVTRADHRRVLEAMTTHARRKS